MNFLYQGFRKLSSDRQTDMTKIIYHAVLRVVNNDIYHIHTQSGQPVRCKKKNWLNFSIFHCNHIHEKHE